MLLTFQRALRHLTCTAGGWQWDYLRHFTVTANEVQRVCGAIPRQQRPSKTPGLLPAGPGPRRLPHSAIWRAFSDLVPGPPSLLPPTRETQATQLALWDIRKRPILSCLSAAHLQSVKLASRDGEAALGWSLPSPTGPGPSQSLPFYLITIQFRGVGREIVSDTSKQQP